MLWLGVAYLGVPGGAVHHVAVDGRPVHRLDRAHWTLDNYRDLFTLDVYRTITVRTLLIAAAVTVIDAVMALPVALYMAKVASPRPQRLLVIAVLTPLWASYLVKAYAWRGMFATGGRSLARAPFGLDTPGYG